MSTPDTRVFDRASVQAVDRAAIEEFGIPGIVLMEHAALAVTREVLEMRGIDAGGRVLIVTGGGNNGGDGWAVARLLHNAGVDVSIVALAEPREGTDAGINRRIARAMNIDEIAANCIDSAPDVDLIVDAIFGTGLSRPVTGRAADGIEAINGHGAPVLAIDLPSGLDCDTGRPLGPVVRASRTVTFVARKTGFDAPGAAEYTGTVVVAGIGAPRILIERYGTDPDPDRGS